MCPLQRVCTASASAHNAPGATTAAAKTALTADTATANIVTATATAAAAAAPTRLSAPSTSSSDATTVTAEGLCLSRHSPKQRVVLRRTHI